MTLRSMTIKNGKAIECGSATIALDCLVFEKTAFFVYAFWRQTDRLDKQMDSPNA